MSVFLNDLINPKTLVALYERNTSMDLIGPPGIGKSSVVRQFPALLSEIYGEPFGYCEQLAPSIDAPDVRGFMVPTKDANGLPISRYTYPAVLPTPEYLAQYPRGIIFIDEFNQSEHLTQKGFSPLLLDKKIGDHKLPDGWWVITASNAVSHKSGVLKPLMHNINRQCRIEVEPVLGGDGKRYGWIDWAQANGVHPMGIGFAKSHPGVIFSAEIPAEPRPFCTPRSFTSAMKFMQKLAGDSMQLPSDTLTQEIVQGDMGEGAAASFFGYIKVADFLPTIQEIKADPEKAKVPPPERLDGAYAAQQLIIHHADASCLDALWAYSERLPRELQVSTAQALTTKLKGAVLNNKGLNEWVKKNSALVMASLH